MNNNNLKTAYRLIFSLIFIMSLSAIAEQTSSDLTQFEGTYLELGCDNPMGSDNTKIVFRNEPANKEAVFTIYSKVGALPESSLEWFYSNFNTGRKWVKDYTTNFWLTSEETVVTSNSLTYTAINYDGWNRIFHGKITDTHIHKFEFDNDILSFTFQSENVRSICRFKKQ